jgi:hypothetical protein
VNHKWENNICVRCGIKRELREYRKPGLPYGVLGRDGCWYDKVPFTHGTAWHYGKPYGFERPNCPITNRTHKSATQQVLNSNSVDG